MIAVAVLAILMAVAVPSFKESSLSSQLRAMANNVIASTHLARSEAFKRNAVVTMCVSTDGATCAGAGSWEQGWIVAAGGVVLERQTASPGGYKINETASVNSLSFQPSGAGSTAATLTVCRATPDVGSQERVVTIDSTGRARVSQTTTASCS